MKTLIKTLLLMCLVNGIAQAIVPEQINYQGRLRESGQPISGSRNMQFKLFNAVTLGTQLWDSGVMVVNVSTGLYSVSLTPAGVDWTLGAIYIETTINGTAFPREQIGSVIYSLHSNNAENINTSASSSTFIINGSTIMAMSNSGLTVYGNVTMTGTSNITPPGAIISFGGPTAPSGWLLCDGASYLRTDYPNLFAMIGVAYGASDGAHFSVPNLADRFPVGKSGTKTLGGTGGSTTIAEANLPAHTHTGSTGGASANHYHSGTSDAENRGHTHGYTAPGANNRPYFPDGSWGSTSPSPSGASDTAGESVTHTHTFSTGWVSADHGHNFTTGNGSGSGAAYNQPYVSVNYIIKY